MQHPSYATLFFSIIIKKPSTWSSHTEPC